MDLKVFYFLLLSAIENTFSFTIPVIGSHLPGTGSGVEGTSGGDLGGLLGGSGTGNKLGSIPCVNSVVKTFGGLGHGIKNEVSNKLIQNTAEQGGEKRLNLLQGIKKGIEGTSGGGPGNLFGGEGNGNGLGSILGVNSVAKTVGGIGQGIKKGIEETSGGGLANLLGGEGNGNGLGSIPGASLVVKAVGGLEEGIKNEVATKLIHNAAEQDGEKRLNLLQGIEKGIEETSGCGLGNLLGGEGNGNGLGSIPGVNSVVKTVGGIGQGIKKGIEGTSEGGLANLLGGERNENGLGSIPGINSVVKTVGGLGQGIKKGIEETAGGGLANLLKGEGTGNGLSLIPDVNSVVKTVGGLGQKIEKAVAKKIITYAAEQGMKNIHEYKTRVLKTIEDFFGGIFGTGEIGGDKDLCPKTEKSLKKIQGVGNGLLTQAEDAIGRISGGVGGGKEESKNGDGNGSRSTSGGIVTKIGGWLDFGVGGHV